MEQLVLDRPVSTAAHAGQASVPRFNLYLAIHKGLRAFMSDTLRKVGCMDTGDAGEVADTLAQTRELLEFCRGHLEHENEFIHTAMQARQPDSALQTADDHVGHQQAIAGLLAAVDALEAAPIAARYGLALHLYHALTLFVAENFEHMHVEETQNNAVLWASYSDAELVDLHGRILAAVGPAEMALALKWMISAVNHAERVGMVGGMRASVPAPVFQGMLGLVRPHLAERNWNKLAGALDL